VHLMISRRPSGGSRARPFEANAQEEGRTNRSNGDPMFACPLIRSGAQTEAQPFLPAKEGQLRFHGFPRRVNYGVHRSRVPKMQLRSRKIGCARAIRSSRYSKSGNKSSQGSHNSGRKYSGCSTHAGTGKFNSFDINSAVQANTTRLPGLNIVGGRAAKKLAILNRVNSCKNPDHECSKSSVSAIIWPSSV
jgi:hypothetical protein